MQIKDVLNEDMYMLVVLNHAMLSSIDPTINEFGSMNTLVHEINNQPDFTAIGLYNDEHELVGFVKGYCFSKKTFPFFRDLCYNEK